MNITILNEKGKRARGERKWENEKPVKTNISNCIMRWSKKRIKKCQILKPKQIKRGMNINGFIYAGQNEGKARD
jgi:hypothetical protein